MPVAAMSGASGGGSYAPETLYPSASRSHVRCVWGRQSLRPKHYHSLESLLPRDCASLCRVCSPCDGRPSMPVSSHVLCTTVRPQWGGWFGRGSMPRQVEFSLDPHPCCMSFPASSLQQQQQPFTLHASSLRMIDRVAALQFTRMCMRSLWIALGSAWDVEMDLRHTAMRRVPEMRG